MIARIEPIACTQEASPGCCWVQIRMLLMRSPFPRFVTGSALQNSTDARAEQPCDLLARRNRTFHSRRRSNQHRLSRYVLAQAVMPYFPTGAARAETATAPGRMFYR